MTNNEQVNVLLVGLEFVQPLFSGNGIMAQSVVRGLLHLNYNVTVLCAHPSSNHSSLENNSSKGKIIENNHISDRMDDDKRLSVVTVPVPMSTWKKLDRYSCYEHLAKGSVSQMTSNLKSIPKYDYVFAIDWSSLPTTNVLKDSGIIPTSSILIYLVFRVFSSSKELCSSDDDYKFYVDRELDGIQQADLTFVLSHVDQNSLQVIQRERLLADHGLLIEKHLHVHVPPLRNDFYLKCQQMQVPSYQHRKYILCNVRLSPEKNALIFAHIVKQLSDEKILKKYKLVPVMIGSVCDDEYAQSVYAILPSETVIINSFLGSEELITILSQTVLMIHPPIYVAYGMTIAEAAAVGTPSLIHKENIGASSLFRVEEGEILLGDMNSPHVVSDCVKACLESYDNLAVMSENTRRRALSWTIDEYARGLKITLDRHLRK